METKSRISERWFFFELGKEIEKDEKKTSFSISLPSSKLTISFISIYKHYAFDSAGPSSMQDACHINFVIEFVYGEVSVAQ